MRVTPASTSTAVRVPTASPALPLRPPPSAAARNAPFRNNGGREGPHSPTSPTTVTTTGCSNSTLSASTALHTCFYFTVFFSNNAPIFHSNRIPAALLGLPATATVRPANPACSSGAVEGGVADSVSPCATCQLRQWQAVFSEKAGVRGGGGVEAASSPPPLEGFAVGDFRSETAALDEVPQQTLQTVAFPTTFGSSTGSGGGGGACPLPTRTWHTRRPRASEREPLKGAASAAVVSIAGAAGAPSPLAAAPAACSTATVKQDDESTSRDSSTSEVLKPKAGMLSHVGGGSFTCHSDVPSAHLPQREQQQQQQNPSANSTRQPYPYQHGIVIRSPNTLPLTTTVSTEGQSTAAHTPTAATATRVSDIPERFMPTFPSVKWEDEDDVEEKAREAATRTGSSNGAWTQRATHAAAGPSTIIITATNPTTSPTAAAPTRVEGALVGLRRPRQRETTATAAAPRNPAATHLSGSTPQPQRTEPAAATATVAASPSAAFVTAAATPQPSSRTAATTATQSPTLTANATKTLQQRPTSAAQPPSSPAVETTVDVTPAAATTTIVREGPPWNMRVEEVRSAKGDLRYYRFILAVSFSALITTHTGVLHSMQTRNAATALVLTCPPSGVHYRYFLHHVDILRSALNRATEFGIRTVQRFFGLLFSPTQKPTGTQQQILKAITSRLEMHSEACETYRAVKAELASALGVLWPLPLLTSASAGWVAPILNHASARTRGGGHAVFSAAAGTAATATNTVMTTTSVPDARNGDTRPKRSGASKALRWLSGGRSSVTRRESDTSAASAPPSPPLSELLCEATAGLCDYSEAFASAFVCGLLSLAEEGEGGQRRTRLYTRAGGEEATAPPTAASVSSSVVSPTTVSSGVAGTRELSCGLPSLSAVDATAPEWLSPYAAYFNNVAARTERGKGEDGGESEEAGGRGGDAVRVDSSRCANGWIRLSRPSAEQPVTFTAAIAAAERQASVNEEEEKDDDDDDACLRTHVSATTVSSMTPVLSPLTVDVDPRSLSARALRSRVLTSPFSTSATTNGATDAAVGTTVPFTAAHTHALPTSAFRCSGTATGPANGLLAAPRTPTTAQLYTISAGTSLTSQQTAMETSTTVGVGDHVKPYDCGGEIASLTGLARPQSSQRAAPGVPAAMSKAPVAAVLSPRMPQPQQQQASCRIPTPTPLQPPRASPPPAAAAASIAKEDAFSLHRGRLGRVVIFTHDATVARRLLLLAAFLRGVSVEAEDGASANTLSSRDGARGAFRCEDAQRMYETAIAAAVTSADFANVPIQWVAEEFSEARLSALCSRFSPENTLLVVIPRQLQCLRVRLRKHVAGTTVLVEQQAGREARIRSPAFPFQCAVTKQTVLLPDPTVTTLLREARSLHESSGGTVDFAEVLQRMVRWLYWQSAAALLKTRCTQVNAVVAAAAAASVPVGGGGAQSAGSFPRFASVDGLWPSRSVSAIGSGATTPTLVAPVALLRESPRVRASAFCALSASPCTPAVLHEQLWSMDSAEESLLPGSRGGARAAWAYAPSTSANGGGRGASSSTSTSAGGGYAPAAAATCSSAPSSRTTSALLVAHGLLQPPSAFVTASPTASTRPQQSSSLRFLSWFKLSPTTAATAASHPHPVLSPTTLSQLSAADGGQLPRLLAEEED